MAIPGQYGSDLAPQELLEEAKKLLAKEFAVNKK